MIDVLVPREEFHLQIVRDLGREVDGAQRRRR